MQKTPLQHLLKDFTLPLLLTPGSVTWAKYGGLRWTSPQKMMESMDSAILTPWTIQGVCRTQEKYTRSFLDVVRLKKLKSEEIFEIRPVVMELP